MTCSRSRLSPTSSSPRMAAGPPTRSRRSPRSRMSTARPSGSRRCKAGRARWADRPRVVTSAHYKDDGQGYTFGDPSQVFVVSVERGDVVQLTSGDRPSVAPAWSPDGARIAFSRARSGTADYHVYDL